MNNRPRDVVICIGLGLFAIIAGSFNFEAHSRIPTQVSEEVPEEPSSEECSKE